MGRWGDGLFQCDLDFDLTGDISIDAGMELYNYEISTDPEDIFHGKGLEATRDHLNSGVFSRLFKKYVDERHKLEYSLGTPFFVLLGICAMRVGATIRDSEMKILRAVAKIMTFGSDELQTAVKYYRNDGTPYNFDSKGLLETVNADLLEDIKQCSTPGCAKYSEELPDGKELRLCGRCKRVCYCDEECQKRHWRDHKKVCKKPEPGKKSKPSSQ